MSMPATLAALAILIFLLPGFVTDRIITSLTLQKPRTDLRLVVDSLVWAFVDEGLYRVVAWAISLPPFPMNYVTDSIEHVFDGHVLSTVCQLIISLLMGVIWSALSSNGLIYALARTLRITRSSGRIDVWQDILTEYREKWVRVHIKDGTIFTGWVAYFSDDPEKRELFLSDAYMESPPVVLTEHAAEATTEIEIIENTVDTEERNYKYTELSGSGILLTDASEIVYIHVL